MIFHTQHQMIGQSGKFTGTRGTGTFSHSAIRRCDTTLHIIDALHQCNGALEAPLLLTVVRGEGGT